jgi:mannobiose 2-epimerase
MAGFLNAWQLTGDLNFLKSSCQSWRFIKQYIFDRDAGEWFFGGYGDYSVMAAEDKVGIWKCPYHNSRACLEIIKRIERNSVT